MSDPTHPPVAAATVTPARILRDAAGYLAEHGWTQIALFDDPAGPDSVGTPPACALGAIAIVCFGEPTDPVLATWDRQHGWQEFHAATAVLGDYLQRTDPPTGNGVGLNEYDGSVADWNDAPGRTADDVMAAMRTAAEDWERTSGGVR